MNFLYLHSTTFERRDFIYAFYHHPIAVTHDDDWSDLSLLIWARIVEFGLFDLNKVILKEECDFFY